MSVNDLDMYACCHLQQAYSHKTLKINHFSAQNEKNNTIDYCYGNRIHRHCSGEEDGSGADFDMLYEIAAGL